MFQNLHKHSLTRGNHVEKNRTLIELIVFKKSIFSKFYDLKMAHFGPIRRIFIPDERNKQSPSGFFQCVNHTLIYKPSLGFSQVH